MRRRLLLACALLVGAVVVWLVAFRHPSTAQATPIPEPLRAQLASRVVDTLEHDPTWRTEVTRDPGARPVCAAAVFGLEPASAVSVDQVRTVYAWVGCSWRRPSDLAVAPASLDPHQLSGLTAPIVLHFGPPAVYQLPADGEGHSASVRRLFPDRLQHAATTPDSSFTDAMDALDERIARIVASAQPSPPK